MINPRDLGADTHTRVPYIEEQILAIVIKGKQRGSAAGRSGSGEGADDHESGDDDESLAYM
ncbi:hypothetical protein Tco_0403014, partial [Tanacetum coccineum]